MKRIIASLALTLALIAACDRDTSDKEDEAQGLGCDAIHEKCIDGCSGPGTQCAQACDAAKNQCENP
jgi:hypothetical protein